MRRVGLCVTYLTYHLVVVPLQWCDCEDWYLETWAQPEFEAVSPPSLLLDLLDHRQTTGLLKPAAGKSSQNPSLTTPFRKTIYLPWSAIDV